MLMNVAIMTVDQMQSATILKAVIIVLAEQGLQEIVTAIVQVYTDSL